MNYKEDNRTFQEKYRIYIYPVVLALIVTMFWKPMIVDGVAMSPTLEDGQVIIIVKEKYSQNRGAPELKSIVSFTDDFYPTSVEGENSTSRVIGLPGDKIAIKSGKVYRNKKVLKEPYAKGIIKEELKEITIAKDEVFVLSDNRENSIDSRNPKVGPVKMSGLRGYLALRVWPLSDFGLLD